MGTWNSSPHPISDIRDWRDLGRLELKPDFQRREVWSNAAKIMLIDTIIANNPMPKIFLSAIIQEKKTHRIVIDGQQRIRAILDFLDNKFKLKAPYTGKFSDCSFDDLPEDIQEEILQYSIDFNEGKKFSDEELRPYFPLNTVLDGLFEIVKRIFGIRVLPAERPEVWHEDVQFFEIRDAGDQRR